MPRTVERRRFRMRLVVIVAVAASILVAAWRAGLFALEDRAQLADAVERVRATPYLVPGFVAVYAIAAAAGVPATPLTLAGGVLFGARHGIAINWFSELLAAAIAFAGARGTGLGARVPSAAASRWTLRGPGAARTLFRLRLIPVAPFALLNVAAALSGMRWRDYLAATAAGILPITVIYTISASELVSGVEGSGARALGRAAAAAIVLIALSFLPSLVRAARRGRP